MVTHIHLFSRYQAPLRSTFSSIPIGRCISGLARGFVCSTKWMDMRSIHVSDYPDVVLAVFHFKATARTGDRRSGYSKLKF